MGRQKAVSEALQQVEDEQHMCASCSSERQEHSKYCVHCEMYWEDFDAVKFDDDYSYGCDCADADYDIIEGTAKCWECGRRWHVSSEEWRRLEKAQREYDEWEAQQPPPEPPSSERRPIRDDEIPF